MRDPVCGMTVGAGSSTVEGYPEFGYCSERATARLAERMRRPSTSP